MSRAKAGTPDRFQCFVAVPFDQPQLTELYAKSLKPVIESKGRVRAVCIDRRRENRDVAQRIREELGSCDFAVADLTFGRPAVYFEAGIVTGKGKPVIYTARDDALAHDVIFHLRTHPIVRWSDPDDREFRSNLAGYVADVTKDLVFAAGETRKVRQLRGAFKALEPAERKSAAEVALNQGLQSLGFTAPARGGGLEGLWGRLSFHAQKTRRDVRLLVAVSVVDAASEESTQRLALALRAVHTTRYHWSSRPDADRLPESVNRLDLARLIVTLRHPPSIEKLREWTGLSSVGNTLLGRKDFVLCRESGKKRRVAIIETLNVIGPVTSVPELTAALGRTLRERSAAVPDSRRTGRLDPET
jgi:hypothetical protein